MADGEFSPDEYYDAYPRIEEDFQRVLDVSLEPRGPDLLYDMVGGLGRPPGASVIDVGCGEGKQTLGLAERFGFHVKGFDPVARHVQLANEQLLSTQFAHLRGLVSFELGSAEALSVDDASVDLVWCRDVLVHVDDIEKAYAEFYRVLAGDGRVLVHQSSFATEKLESREAGWLWRTSGVVPNSARLEHHEAAIEAAGLRVDERIEVGIEWAEWAEEQSGRSSRRLLHAARLLREPARYVQQFGQPAYDIMLADCMWHFYHMIGKLSAHVFLLSRW